MVEECLTYPVGCFFVKIIDSIFFLDGCLNVSGKISLWYVALFRILNCYIYFTIGTEVEDLSTGIYNRIWFSFVRSILICCTTVKGYFVFRMVQVGCFIFSLYASDIFLKIVAAINIDLYCGSGGNVISIVLDGFESICTTYSSHFWIQNVCGCTI